MQAETEKGSKAMNRERPVTCRDCGGRSEEAGNVRLSRTDTPGADRGDAHGRPSSVGSLPLAGTAEACRESRIMLPQFGGRVGSGAGGGRVRVGAVGVDALEANEA